MCCGIGHSGISTVRRRYPCNRTSPLKSSKDICSIVNANLKGNVAELEIAAAAARLGIPVLKPLSEHARCDLAFEIGRRLWRVQCKWGRLARGGDVVIVTTSGCRHSPRGYVRTHYANGEVDLFAVYCGGLDRCFLLPDAIVAGGTRYIYA